MTDQERLLALLGTLRPQSHSALQHAMAVAGIEGVEGTLIIQIPKKAGEPLDLAFVTGRARLSLD